MGSFYACLQRGEIPVAEWQSIPVCQNKSFSTTCAHHSTQVYPSCTDGSPPLLLSYPRHAYRHAYTHAYIPVYRLLSEPLSECYRLKHTRTHLCTGCHQSAIRVLPEYSRFPMRAYRILVQASPGMLVRAAGVATVGSISSKTCTSFRALTRYVRQAREIRFGLFYGHYVALWQGRFIYWYQYVLSTGARPS